MLEERLEVCGGDLVKTIEHFIGSGSRVRQQLLRPLQAGCAAAGPPLLVPGQRSAFAPLCPPAPPPPPPAHQPRLSPFSVEALLSRPLPPPGPLYGAPLGLLPVQPGWHPLRPLPPPPPTAGEGEDRDEL